MDSHMKYENFEYFVEGNPDANDPI